MNGLYVFCSTLVLVPHVAHVSGLCVDLTALVVGAHHDPVNGLYVSYYASVMT